MKLMTTIFCALYFSSAFANLHLAPPNLNINGVEGVFVDIQTAKTVLTYDISKRTAIAKTTLELNQPVSGKVIFDLVNEPTKILFDDQLTSSSTTSMDGVSTVRYLDRDTAAGNHTLVITNEIDKNISFSTDYVKSAFWMSDLSDRRYLEQYLPTNLEYDQYQTDLEVKIVGTDAEHVLYTNGSVNELSINHWKVSYPAGYTASSYFYHLTKKGLIPEEKATYKSIDGRVLPVTVYTDQSTSRFMSATLEILAELEADYGPFPHAQVIIYGAGSGGMEYCGATITSFSALGHELTHSYFARGIMPAHGNAGWVDEAIASWRDGGYRSYTSRSLSRTDMAGHSVYQRTTDRDAYTRGMRFIGFLNDKFQAQESFKVFLKEFFTERKFKPFKTEEFQKAIEDFYNADLARDFDSYVYGKKGTDKHAEIVQENPNHPKLSDKQIFDLL
ncbi:MAG: hypothetical protein COW01_04920 [Bdellovibrionales bacterium CG12_big_fil_rev_8_21_14_0_65_38_15]|nr:MAG: hypothetical protein COW79_14200 [Bdellovibrionales bacterium CG22_combo_CG10-13_8_21_14_all_38_13]PIQ56226.1 MAG: hypothetical protein COW01_04920 [Bdellovibrionales bacterium CG12_big_fil_rev_8_21_14_0_65_38_15]PIR30370.1 MAG: hypothetical protein COV38_06365 [Bdellovibrionales bacterium CG11_big_fil_rev_8_21_14_0_20_38_13]